MTSDCIYRDALLKDITKCNDFCSRGVKKERRIGGSKNVRTYHKEEPAENP